MTAMGESAIGTLTTQYGGDVLARAEHGEGAAREDDDKRTPIQMRIKRHVRAEGGRTAT